MFRGEKNHKLVQDSQSLKVPAEFNLAQNSPNPFSGQTAICFSVPRPTNVMIALYNQREELQCVLHSGHLKPGNYRLIWNGTDAKNRPLQPGSYNYCLQAEGFFITRKLIITQFGK